MDKLSECIQAYERLLYKEYILTLENGMLINLRFETNQFSHLIGLHYLTDVRQVQKTPVNGAAAIYQNLKKGRICYADLQKSALFDHIANRIEYFPHVNELLEQKIIIDFDRRKVKKTDFKAKYILYKPHELGYLHLCLAENAKIFYPESYIYEPSKYYISEQTLLDIVNVEIKSLPRKRRR